MNYEQKYKIALERAKKFYNDEGCRVGMTPVDLEAIFPELAESKDERIRKQIISFLKEFECDHYRSLDFSSWIAWLEKQGKETSWKPSKEEMDALYGIEDDVRRRSTIQVLEYARSLNTYNQYGKADIDKNIAWLERVAKPVYNVEPRFKVGDWVVLTAGELSTTLQIVNVDINKKLYWFNDGSYLPIVDEEGLHLWTIQDAKDGDVLCVKYGNNEMPFIFTGKQNDVAYCSLNSFGEFVLSMADWLLKTSVLPATKEQRDILFQKMKEKGYEWDADEKVLNKVIIYE